jgi:hypothetical protein
MKDIRRKRGSKSGNTILEFALVSLVLIPCCLGVAGLGMALGNFVKVSQTVRDAAHMFARGIDFDRDDNKDIIVRLASSLHITRNGGDGVVIFSKIVTPTQEDCAAAGRPTNCPNRGLPVFVHRVIVGNQSLRNSRYGTPASGIVSADGNITSANYLTQASAVAAGFATTLAEAGMAQERGDVAYLVEGQFSLPALQFLGYAPNGAYCRYIF